jgi:hypothetical protein
MERKEKRNTTVDTKNLRRFLQELTPIISSFGENRRTKISRGGKLSIWGSFDLAFNLTDKRFKVIHSDRK